MSFSGLSILVTGGTGYIGSHTVVELLTSGAQVTIVDNLSNSSKEVLNRIEQITGKRPEFHELDCRDGAALSRVFESHRNRDSSGKSFDAVIHFAALKAVGESNQKPLEYYDNNLVCTLELLKTMRQFSCYSLVFSSSATVYGVPKSCPIDESAPLSTTNPYGTTKLMIEQILRDLAKSDPRWKIAILRYFNPIGAHASGTIGEHPQGIPNNLLPYITQVAVGLRPHLNVFGSDYDTPDGTGVRDYIHVVDLARGHLAAILEGIQKAKQNNEEKSFCESFNLGTGSGVSVMEMIRAVEECSGRPVPYQVVPRRDGDVATCFADASKANSSLHWTPKFSFKEAVASSWKWQSMNPKGFDS